MPLSGLRSLRPEETFNPFLAGARDPFLHQVCEFTVDALPVCSGAALMGAGITIGQVPGKILSLRSALKASNINKVKDRPALLPSAGFNVFFGVTLANSYVRLALNPGGLIIGCLLYTSRCV